MDSANNKTSFLVNTQLPEFVRRDHPLFIEFLENYYKFLEQDGEMLYTAKRFPEFYDIDVINADIKHDAEEGEGGPPEDERYHVLQQEFYNNFIRYVPTNSLADLNLILKQSKDFYRSTGSQKSVRFLARILFNKNADIYYPQLNILKASDGKWFVEKSINIKDIAVDNVANTIAFSRFANTQIRGAVSNSTCVVESVNPYYDSGVLVTELKVSQVQKDFIDGEQITCTIEDEGYYKTLSANVYSGIVVKTTVTEGGSGYVEGAGVPVLPSDEFGLVAANGSANIGVGAQIIINKVSKGHLEGKIKAVDVIFPGAGYKVNDALLFTGGGGKDAAANVYSVDDTETYHPAYYSIVGSTIDLVANTVIQNAVGDYVETQAYSNLATQYSNTSNLDISTIPGGTILNITLNKNLANSNVYFETGDVLFVQNTYQTITASNKYYWQLTVSPGLPGGLANVSFNVFKKPNVNTIVANSMAYWSYGPCGPIIACAITNPGSGYVELPTVSVLSNTYMRSLGVLGRMEIIDGGLNYTVGDQIEFINPYGTYGIGANAQVSVVDANGSITEVNFFALPGHLPGGSGYRADFLPRANVRTSTGNGANIMVTATIGDDAVVNAKSNVIGSIASLKIVSGGLGYEYPPIIDLSTQGDGTAQAYANIVTGIYTYPGRYLNQDGQPSSYNFLQDRDYYQNYSYVVKIEESLDNYRKALKDLIHPAGLKLFGEYLFEDNNQTVANGINVINSAIQTGVNTSNLIVSFDAANNLVGNIWYNSANTKQYANLANGVYKTGGGVFFDGNNDTVIMTHKPSLNVTNNISVVTWFYVANTDNTGKSLVTKTDTGYTRGFDLYNYGNKLEVIVRPTTANNKLVVANNIVANTWTMVAFTYDGTTIKGYVNGQQMNVSTGTANSATDTDGQLYIGGRYAANANVSNVMTGRIAMTQIYSRALSNNEISKVFAKYRGRFGI